jgi:hypothetical protein
MSAKIGLCLLYMNGLWSSRYTRYRMFVGSRELSQISHSHLQLKANGQSPQPFWNTTGYDIRSLSFRYTCAKTYVRTYTSVADGTLDIVITDVG